MDELKQQQPSMSIKEQITNLKNIGLIIEDEAYAEKILNDISYFRLTKAYSLTLKAKNDVFKNDITFEHLVELYRFNANFRQLLFPEIEKIEINMRCRISNHFADTYGVLGYKQSDNFANEMYHNLFNSQNGKCMN